MNSTTTPSGNARVATHNRKLYDGRLTLGDHWAHLDNAYLLSRHLDGYVGTPVGSVTLNRGAVKYIRWTKDGSV